MKTSLARRSLVGLGLLLTIVLLSGFWPNIPEVDKRTPGTAQVPPPTHVRWFEHDVSGLMLVDPAPMDSAGNYRALGPLPDGTLIEIPYIVPGPDPEGSLEQERKKT